MPFLPSRFIALFMLAAALQGGAALAQPTAPALAGRTADAQPFDLAARRDKVVLLVFWSTDCAVCRDKMAELRANARGWQGQPFELVGVNTDRTRDGFDRWRQLVEVTVPADQRFTQLWRGQPGLRDGFGDVGTLPAAFLIDKAGRVVERYNGRIPPETWDRIAELL
ncbi:MAG: TlpA family protein disulfide reductase [Hydrogenophaga sp.]|nr:TlpA family protein disulfide reductase [Hydrogenophaga sp.]